ncbi:MAG: nitroreductase family deazaflavin-dependent oxidoreductase [Anaerolineales bacterium]
MNQQTRKIKCPRESLRAELESTREKFHALLAGLTGADWHIPSGNPAWTIGELMYHVAMGQVVISIGAKILRKGRRLPIPAGALIDQLNVYTTRRAARGHTRQSVAKIYDEQHARVLRALDGVRDDEWQNGATYPDIDPPLLAGFVTVEDLFRSQAHHFEQHAADVRAGLDILRVAGEKHTDSPVPFQQRTQGFMSYPGRGWQKAMFKAPIQLWRLGFAPLVGRITMLITQTGRKSGLPRRTMVEYHPLDGVKYVPVAFGRKAQWYKNIEADPRVTIQTADGVERMQAVRVTGDRELLAVYNLFSRRDPPLTRWYLKSLDINPDDPLDVLLKKDRIYWLRFDPITDDLNKSDDLFRSSPPPLEADLKWVLPAVAAGLVGAWLFSRRKK